MAVIIDIITVSIGLIAAGATVVLAIITWRYVRLTNDILEENRQMRIDAQKPDIAIRLHPHTNELGDMFAQLHVENNGSGPARSIKFHDVPPIPVHLGPLLQYFPFFRYGIGYLAPGDRKKVHLGGKAKLNLNELEYKITVTYRDSGRRKYRDTFSLDFRELWGE